MSVISGQLAIFKCLMPVQFARGLRSETPVPSEQISQMQSIAPDCTINTTVTDDPTGECWRYTGYDPEIPLYYWVPRYELLRNQVGYNYQEYSFYWLDPLCDVPAPAEHAGKYGKEVYG